jgi:two-component system OmpR family sensor kinase
MPPRVRSRALSRLVRARHSIRWRLTLWISALLIVSVGVAFAIIYSETSARLSAQIRHDLNADTTQLQQSLQIAEGDTRGEVVSDIRHYVDAQPFRSISTLLFVLAPGTTISNYPELFSALEVDDGENLTQQQAENTQAQQISRPHLGVSTRLLPDVGQVRLLERRIRLADGMVVVVGAGEPLVSLHRAQEGVVHSFLLAAGFIALAVLLGSWLVGSRLTAPLRRMARVAAQVDAGDLEPRMQIDERRRDEIGVLANAFNHMLGRLEHGFRNQREFIADASHELRTPLTVIQGQLEVLANRRQVDRDEVRRVERLVEGEVLRMRRIVDDLLLLAQSERPDFLKPETLELDRFVGQIWDGATLIAERRFELGPLARGRLHADPDRLAQALRNLINNAIDHTTPLTGTIRLEAHDDVPGSIRILLLDDGPGIAPEELERIFHRFHRTGASRSRPAGPGQLGGAGLGLSIVRAIAEAHGGAVAAGNRRSGGAWFELRLPGFERAAPARRPPARRPPAVAPAGAHTGPREPTA